MQGCFSQEFKRTSKIEQKQKLHRPVPRASLQTKHQRRPIRENVTVGSCLSWPRLSKTVVETNTEMPLPQRNPRKAVTGKGLPCPGFDERGCTWPGATCKYKEFRNGHERYHPKCTRCMKRAANPSHGQSSPQTEPQDHDAARPSSFETSESAPERPQNVSDLGAGPQLAAS